MQSFEECHLCKGVKSGWKSTHFFAPPTSRKSLRNTSMNHEVWGYFKGRHWRSQHVLFSIWFSHSMDVVYFDEWCFYGEKMRKMDVDEHWYCMQRIWRDPIPRCSKPWCAILFAPASSVCDASSCAIAPAHSAFSKRSRCSYMSE